MTSLSPAWAKRVDTDHPEIRARISRERCLGLTIALLLVSSIVLPAKAIDGDDPSFTITFNDGEVSPSRLEVPAETRFEIRLINNGQTPAEFESIPLSKEKVIGPGVSTFIVIKYLDPGEYSFFDDFHPDAPPAVLVAVPSED